MIIASAIKFYYADGTHKFPFPQIWTGLRHADILERMFYNNVEYDKATAVQGFLTDDNKFVDRFEAAGIAWDCGQIDNQPIQLYSEDLWPE